MIREHPSPCKGEISMKNKHKGLFITFEGGEGSGKTTQIKSLAACLQKKGYEVVITREPGGTPLADRIRSTLLDSKTKGLSPFTELFLYEIARRDHVMTVIQPALNAGKIVLCDRFTDSTLVYQGAGRGLPLRRIQILNEAASGSLKPDLTLLLDLPVAIGLRRAKKRIKKEGSRQDRFERESFRFHTTIRNAFLTLARKESIRFVILDGLKTRQTLSKEIGQQVAKQLERLGLSSFRPLLRRASRNS